MARYDDEGARQVQRAWPTEKEIGLTNATSVLVTGGAGFIGSHAAAELLRRGRAVRVGGNCSTGKRANLAAVGGDVELVEGDVRSYERTQAATQGVDCAIHLAALPSVQRSIQDPLTTNAVNVTGTLSVVPAAATLPR